MNGSELPPFHEISKFSYADFYTKISQSEN